MCRTIGKCFDDRLTFKKLMEAHSRTCVNKANKSYVLRFNMDLESNIINILDDLKNDRYVPSEYRSFFVYEPKKRLIKALPYRDRIVQQWYIGEFIKPYIVPRFIKDSYACISGRGTHKAVGKIEEYMRKMKRKYGSYYILKCDISKYFYSIDKDILYNIMKRYIRDKKLLKLTRILIYDDDKDIGIPIGNYTSQFYANIYLNELDKYVKNVLKLDYYVRYMDDFVILLKSKNECRLVMREIEQFLECRLKLKLNKNSRYYKSSGGVNFCGYKIYETHRLLRGGCKKKIKRKIRYWNKYGVKNIILSWNSFLAHSSHCNSYNFRKKIYDDIVFKDYLRLSR